MKIKIVIFYIACCFVSSITGVAAVHAKDAHKPKPVKPEQTTPSWQGGTLSAAEFVGIETIRLWPDSAPGAIGEAPEDIPTLTIFRPGYPNGSAVLIAPGGGYRGFAPGVEGREVADWYTARGFTAFVLKYRLLPAYPMPAPLLDAQRAIRWIRANSKALRVNPQRIGMVGFSAGGNLAALTGTRFKRADAQSVDPIDQHSDRPNFLVLGYPVVSRYAKLTATQCKLLFSDCSKEFLQSYNPIPFITAQTPPIFIYHTSEDGLVTDSIELYNAAYEAGIAVELHIFAHGKHGSGLGAGNLALGAWPTLMENWLRQKGFLDLDPTVQPGADIPVATGKGFSIDTPLAQFEANPIARSILIKHFDVKLVDRLLKSALTLRRCAEIDVSGSWIDHDKLHELSRELATIPKKNKEKR
ncbi:MAG: alpha/beta hydrolase [Porticoccaceae bacterium]|nr:alpha/beta hydrolase [Porticoccaceae bacterium]